MDRRSQWTADELRSTLLQVIADPNAMWRTPTGHALFAQVDRFLAPHIARWVRTLHGYAMEPTEVTHSIAIQLADPDLAPTLTKAFTVAENSWAYLAICTRRWAASEAGHRVGELDALIHLPPAPNSAADAALCPDHGLTPLDVVIERTTHVVRAFVEASDRRPYRDAVRWFAENPITHQGHGHACAKRAPELLALGFSPEDVAALARVTWGGRPNMHVTSLLHAFLLDEQFNPHASRPHRAALMAMRRTLCARSTMQSASQVGRVDASPRD